MLPFFWYMLKVMICSGILFGYYWLFLRNKLFHQYNRFYLLSSLVISLLLPLLKIDFRQTDTGQNQVIKVLQAVSAGDEYIILTTQKNSWGLGQLYPILYLLVSLVFFLIMLRTLVLIRKLLKQYKVQQVEQVFFVNTEDSSTPFSFLKYIFWNSSIDINTPTGRQIFNHEVAHIQEKHTFDKLLVNIILVFCWSNLFFWLYRKELNMIHEFIADKKAVQDSDTSAFAAMILQAAYPKHRFELVNNFFYSPIKRRLMMLTKNNNPKVNYIARIMVLPLAVLIFAAFTFKTKSNPAVKTQNPDAVKNNKNGYENCAYNTYMLNAQQQSQPAVMQPLDRTDTTPKIKSITIQEETGKPVIEIENHKSNLLFIVDGVIQGKYFNLDQIKPNDIASVDVIKNEAAIAKFGQHGKDGVIVIRTKKMPVTGINADNVTAENELLKLKIQENKLALAKQDLVLQQKIFEEKKYTLSQQLALTKINTSEKEDLLARIKEDDAEKQKATIEEYDKAKQAFSKKLDEAIADGYHADNSKLLEKKTEGDKKNMISLQSYTIPEFTGGKEAWIKFLQANLKAGTPVDNGAKAGKYTVILKFIVNADGTLSDVTCESDPGFGMGAEAIRFIKTTPRWQPAILNGKKVNAYMKQPITFVVEDQ